MKLHCIVCASEFETEEDSGQLTCSEGCKAAYREFLTGLKLIHPANKDKYINEFFAPILKKDNPLSSSQED